MFFKLSRLIFFIITLLFIAKAVQTAMDYHNKSGKIKAERQEIEKLRREQTKLKKTLEKVKGVEFVEEEARNKLNMCLPGETVVIGE